MGFQFSLLSFSSFSYTVIVHVRPTVATCPLAWGEEVESASWVGAEARTFGYPRRPPRLGHGSCLVSEAHIPPLATPLPLGKTSIRLIEYVSLGQVAAQKLLRSSLKGTQRRELDCDIRVR